MDVDKETLAAFGKIAAIAYDSKLLARRLIDESAKKEAEDCIKEILDNIKKLCIDLRF